MSVLKQYCTFYLNGHFFGVEVGQVQEVIRYQEMTRVPLAQNTISGLINLRGQIVTAIDLRKRMLFPERTTEKLPMNVVLKTADGAVSLLVDEIGDVIDVNEEDFELPPETLQGEARDLILGAYKLQNKLLLIIEVSKVLNLPPTK